MDTTVYLKERFNQLQATGKGSSLDAIRTHAFQAFSQMGIPSVRNEEWKYTRIGGLFNKEYQLPIYPDTTITTEEINAIRLPGHEAANELVFVNGIFSVPLSNIRSDNRQLVVLPL